MKKSVLTLLIIALFTFSVGLQSAMAISLTDYKFPDSTSQQAYLEGDLNMARSSKKDTQRSLDFSGSAYYDLFFRSLPLSYGFHPSGKFSFEKSNTEGEDTDESYDLNLNANVDKYLKDESKVFAYGSTKIEYRKLSDQTDADDPYADVTVGVGYGRSIDATVLKQAIRMNDDFKKYGVITQDIPDEALLKLAAIIDRQDEYRTTHGPIEYRKFWYEDMEKVLSESGVLKGGSLGARGVIRIQKVLDEPTGLRFYGWDVRGGVGLRISNFNGEEGDPLLSLEFNWAVPVNLELQLTNKTSARTVFGDDQTYTLSDEFKVYYEITDRVDWDNRFKVEYNFSQDEKVKDSWALNASTAYIFYLANRLDFKPGLYYNYLGKKLNDNEANEEWKLLATLSYRLK